MSRINFSVTSLGNNEEGKKDIHDFIDNNEAINDKERHKKFADKAIELGDIQPFVIAWGSQGRKMNLDGKGVISVDDAGEKESLIIVDNKWVDARKAEYSLAGKSKREVDELVGKSVAESLSRAFVDIAKSYAKTTNEVSFMQEVHPVELVCDVLACMIAEARDNGIPGSVIRSWMMMPALMAVDKNDIENILTDAVDKFKKKVERKEGGENQNS